MENEIKKKKEGFHLEHWHIIALGLMLYDALALGLSYLIALWLRFDLRYSMIDRPYNETSCELKNLPGMYQLVTGQVMASAMRRVSVEDLLGRDPISVDLQEVFQFIHGKTELVAGGGGSIGSELCRQIAAHSPKELIIFDIYENNAYSIQLELKNRFPELKLFTHKGMENADKDSTGAVFQDIQMEFVAVRFGNILGSNGSIIPIFKKQLEKGGPVTVTHPDIL